MTSAEITYHRRLIIGVTTFCEFIGIASFVLRLWARRIQKASLWWDDYVMGVALVFASIPGVCNYIRLQYGLGQHASQVEESDIHSFLKAFYVLQIAYLFTLPTTKISVLLFYHRVFYPRKQFRWAIYGVGVYLILFLLSSALAFSFQCSPVRSFWEPDIPHRCIDQVGFYIAHGTLNFISDLVVVFMPVPLLLALQLPRHQKTGVVVLFLLGGLACGISLCRIISLREVDHNDITWSDVVPCLWSSAEVEVLVLSANLPLMRPLFRLWARKSEDASDTLELSASSERRGQQRPYNPIVERSPGYRATSAHGTIDDGGKGRFRDDLPRNRIMVDMDVEHSVLDLDREAKAPCATLL